MDSYRKKMAERIAEVNSSRNEMKVAQDKYRESVKKLNHVYEMMVKKEQKQANKPKKERKACGFAVAVPVSDVMCEFMEVETGSLVARTDITKRLNAYIKDFPGSEWIKDSSIGNRCTKDSDCSTKHCGLNTHCQMSAADFQAYGFK